MTLITVPGPPKSAFNKDRPVSSLLRSHLEHLQRAEFRLPGDMQTNIYINAIKTEGEAADYIKLVTERLHAAHEGKGAPVGKSGIAIVAAAATPKRKGKSARKTKITKKGGSKRKK
ncbi:MAG: hypothetical protein LAN83_14260 [Acidobacteriia bacterium]|nr:hypothetical protein [Terriglobia bacterium]